MFENTSASLHKHTWLVCATADHPRSGFAPALSAGSWACEDRGERGTRAGGDRVAATVVKVLKVPYGVVADVTGLNSETSREAAEFAQKASGFVGRIRADVASRRAARIVEAGTYPSVPRRCLHR